MSECNDAQETAEIQTDLPEVSSSQEGLSRRGFLGSLSTTAALLPLVGFHILSSSSTAQAAPLALPAVGPIPAGSVSRTDFSSNEQRVARFLATLAALANAVEDEDAATYGFITGGFWRTPAVPYNARVMENSLTLAYFYSTQRAWNPYYNNQALKQRMEAAFSYWLSLQHSDGSFAEYNPDEHSRAATGFALTWVGYMFHFLDAGPGINASLRASVLTAIRKAANWFLAPTNETIWVGGMDYSNQVAGGLLGIGMLQSRFNDPALDALFTNRIQYFVQNAQSSAGYFVERGEVDHGYSYGVMTPDMALLYEKVKRPELLSMQKKHFDWLQYNFMWEPDGAGFITNGAINGRTGLRFLDAYVDDTNKAEPNFLWSQYISQSAAYRSTAEDRNAARAAWRQGAWEDIQPLGTGEVDPFLLRILVHTDSQPSRSVRQAAIATFPYLRSTSFTEFRKDSKRGYEYLFVRRPAYYTGLALGKRSVDNSPKRSGLSFLWHPQMGTLIHSLSGATYLVWSTRKQQQVDALGDVPARYFNGTNQHQVAPEQLAQTGMLHVHYAPSDNWCDKRVSYHASGLDISVTTGGEFSEQIPLVLQPEDRLKWLGSSAPLVFGGSNQVTTARGFLLERHGQTFQIEWGPVARSVNLNTSTTTFFKDGTRILHLLTISAQDQFSYRCRFASGAVTIVDDLNDWRWTSSHTSGWSFDTSNAELFEGDTSRIKRSGADTVQSVVYHYTNISTFSAKVYYRNSASNRVSVYASSNGSNWTAVPLQWDTPVNTDRDWYRVNFSPASNIPGGTNYLRVEFKNDPLVYAPQLGQFTLKYIP